MTAIFNADEIFAIAEQIERNGIAFYQRAAERFEGEQKRRLLGLSVMEKVHQQLFAAMRRELSESDEAEKMFDPEGEAEKYLAAIAGGEIFEIEVSRVPGNGKLLITGNLKEIMRESAEAAFSFARGRCAEESVKFLEGNHIHIHVPEGAIPKDGPSAGIAIATALVSLFRNQSVRKDVAMTGEVTLRGKVLPIGGLPEKAVAAVRVGARHLVIPKENEKDYRELAPVVRKKLTVHLVETMDEVLDLALQ